MAAKIIPIGRIVTAEEIANVAAFLAGHPQNLVR